jgi:hypothetical protein
MAREAVLVSRRIASLRRWEHSATDSGTAQINIAKPHGFQFGRPGPPSLLAERAQFSTGKVPGSLPRPPAPAGGNTAGFLFLATVTREMSSARPLEF